MCLKKDAENGKRIAEKVARQENIDGDPSADQYVKNDFFRTYQIGLKNPTT